MSFKKLFSKVAIISSVFTVGATAIFAQEDTPSQDPSTKVRKVGKEKEKIYTDWVNKDVAYIITNEEKKAFKQLKTDEERENFIANFWLRRDPNPDTEENEFREEYYERIAYANENYTSGIPGWKTDRGRIYITWGKPDSVESHPSGGSYDRPSYEGGGSTTTYPFEIWFYRYLEGVGSGIEIEFVDPTGTGEYRIARNANEKDALAMVPGAGLTLNEQLGIGDKGDRLSNIGNNYMREQDSPFRRMEILRDLSTPPQVKYSDLQASMTDSPVIDNNPLEFDMRVDFFRQSDDRVVTAFTVQADNSELTFKDQGGIQTARMNIFGRILAVSGKRSGIFEDSVTANATPEEMELTRIQRSVYQKAIALTPGRYKVDVIVRDVETGSKGIRTIGFEVPKYEESKLATSTLILATKLRSTTERDIGGMFIIGDTKVIPNLSSVYKQGQEVGIYLQVYNSGIDQTTLRPAVDVNYVLTKDGKELLNQKENWEGLSDSGQRLTLARLLSTAGMQPGDYEIKVKIIDKVPNAEGKIQTLTPTAKFTITK